MKVKLYPHKIAVKLYHKNNTNKTKHKLFPKSSVYGISEEDWKRISKDIIEVKYDDTSKEYVEITDTKNYTIPVYLIKKYY